MGFNLGFKGLINTIPCQLWLSSCYSFTTVSISANYGMWFYCVFTKGAAGFPRNPYSLSLSKVGPQSKHYQCSTCSGVGRVA
jgi:hypothetical protein